jgi:hypothetical protein
VPRRPQKDKPTRFYYSSCPEAGDKKSTSGPAIPGYCRGSLDGGTRPVMRK